MKTASKTETTVKISEFMKKQTLDFVKEGKSTAEIIKIFNNHNFDTKYWNKEGVEDLITKYKDFMKSL